MNNIIKLVLMLIICSVASNPVFSSQYLTPQDIKSLPSTPADHRLQYGDAPQQFGDLRLPKDEGPFPVLIVIHGGCWSSKIANVNIMSAFSQAFTQKGLATWNIEYRCVDDIGGGWPGTFQDIGSAIDYLRTIAPQYHLDLNKVAIIGHSAGGHLALWAASRHRLAKNSILYSSNPLPICGVIDLAGPGNLKNFMPMQESVCRDAVVTKLLGGTAGDVTERIQQGSPYELLPLGVKQILITGANDPAVPPALGQQYVDSAKAKGDDIELILAKDASHFEVIAPGSNVWPMVENAVFSLIMIDPPNIEKISPL